MSKAITAIVSAIAFLALVIVPSAVANRVTTGLWDTSVTPSCIANGTGPCFVADTGGLELGVKFQTSKAINVVGVRFYRADAGMWSGSLWNANGTHLVAANDSTSDGGWQTAMFTSPETMMPGDTFVASYYAPSGGYAFDWDYFTSGGYTTGPVTALGGAGVNGVFNYSPTSIFPTTVFRDTNYWVTPLWVELYNFSGFFQPVDNLPTLNTVKAGQAIPVKFSLSGNQGLSIFATGYPKSQQITCNSTESTDGIEATVTAGSSSLSYDATADQYTYVWKTDKAWANTCRQLVIKLDDLTTHVANFNYTK